MGGVASAVADVVGDAVESVGDVVSDVGDAVTKNIVEPIVDTVDATIQAAVDDPIGTAVKVAAISTMNPAIIAAANAAVAVAHGASLEQAALAAGKGYVAGAIGAEVSSGLSPEFAASGDLTASQAATAANIAGNVAGATAVGGDPLQALVAGGVGAGTAALTAEIPGFAEMSKAQQRAVNSAVSKTLQGRDPSQGLINEAIASGVSAAQSYARAPSDDLVEQTVTPQGPSAVAPTPTPEPLPLPEPTPAPSTELMDVAMSENAPVIAAAPIPEDYTAQTDQDEFYRSIGIDPAGLSSFNSSTEDPLAGMSTRGDYDQITGKFVYDPNGSMEAPLTDASGTNVSSMDGYTTKNGITTGPDGQAYDLSYLQSSNKPLDTHSLDYLNQGETDLGALARSLLSAAPSAARWTAGAALGAKVLSDAGSGSKDGLIYTAEPVQNQTIGWNQQSGNVNDGVAYGLDQLGGTYINAAQGGIMSLAQGGQIPSLGGYAAGGNPRLLRGPGDGMSDNIPATIAGKQPARLADGEFVVPADVVSHLGNGSTEAGANVLYQMMERVRKARTGTPKQGRQINPQKFVPRKGK